MFLFMQGKFLDIEFDYKGDPIGGHLMHCKYMCFTNKVEITKLFKSILMRLKRFIGQGIFVLFCYIV